VSALCQTFITSLCLLSSSCVCINWGWSFEFVVHRLSWRPWWLAVVMTDDDVISDVLCMCQLKQVTLYQLVKKVKDSGSKSSPSKAKTSSSNTPQKMSGKTPPPKQTSGKAPPKTPKPTPYRLPPVVARFVDTNKQLTYYSVYFIDHMHWLDMMHKKVQHCWLQSFVSFFKPWKSKEL